MWSCQCKVQLRKGKLRSLWASQFKDDRESLEDLPRSGRPKTTYTAENIERVRAIIEEEPHATHEIIEAVKSIHHLTINEVINNDLQKRKLASC